MAPELLCSFNNCLRHLIVPGNDPVMANLLEVLHEEVTRSLLVLFKLCFSYTFINAAHRLLYDPLKPLSRLNNHSRFLWHKEHNKGKDQ